MTHRKQDDFAWLVEQLEPRKKNRTRLTMMRRRERTYWRERFEAAESLPERRRSRASILLILLQLLPFLVAVIFFLLR